MLTTVAPNADNDQAFRDGCEMIYKQLVDELRRQGLKAIEAALKRIDGDEYGWCEHCGEEIAMGRLELDPTAARCVDCASG